MRYKVFHALTYKIPYYDRIIQDVPIPIRYDEPSLSIKYERIVHERIRMWGRSDNNGNLRIIFSQFEMKKV